MVFTRTIYNSQPAAVLAGQSVTTSCAHGALVQATVGYYVYLGPNNTPVSKTVYYTDVAVCS